MTGQPRYANVVLEDGTVLRAQCVCRSDVRRVSTMQQFVLNGLPSGVPLRTGVVYECAVCGTALVLMARRVDA
jgi:hypothetical protein